MSALQKAEPVAFDGGDGNAAAGPPAESGGAAGIHGSIQPSAPRRLGIAGQGVQS